LAEVMMRGTDKRSGELFSYVDLEQRVRMDHPLRVIREVVSTALAAQSGDFAGERLEFDLLFRWFVGLGVASQCGIIRASRRTATGCWMATSRPSFWPPCWPSRG
jgi:hypothetical protein